MSDNKTIDNVHVHIYGHEMLSELITRARKNNIPYDKEMKYDFHSHGHSYLVFKDGELTLLEDPSENYEDEISLNGFFELYLSKEEVKKEIEVGKWYISVINNIIYYGGEDKIYGLFRSADQWINKIEDMYDNFQCFVNAFNNNLWREATPQEVEKALIEEAKRRGYKEGIKFKSLIYDKDESKLSSAQLDWDEVMDGWWHLRDSFGESIFHNGQWATIIEQPVDKFAELKEAHRNGKVIQINNIYGGWADVVWKSDLWLASYEYRIKPEEGLKIGDKVIGIRTDCAIIGEVTSVSKKKVCVNNLAFLKDQVSPLTAVQYDDVRFLINGLKGHD